MMLDKRNELTYSHGHNQTATKNYSQIKHMRFRTLLSIIKPAFAILYKPTITRTQLLACESVISASCFQCSKNKQQEYSCLTTLRKNTFSNLPLVFQHQSLYSSRVYVRRRRYLSSRIMQVWNCRVHVESLIKQLI